MSSKKMPDGTVVIRCEHCGHWRHFSDFLVGDRNPKKEECWDRTCAICRRGRQPYCGKTREVIGMPEDAEWDDIAEPCGCGDGSYHGHRGKVGVCYRCRGKAELSWKDMARNYHFDLRQALQGVKEDEEYLQPDPEEQSATRVKEDEEDFLDFIDF